MGSLVRVQQGIASSHTELLIPQWISRVRQKRYILARLATNGNGVWVSPDCKTKSNLQEQTSCEGPKYMQVIIGAIQGPFSREQSEHCLAYPVSWLGLSEEPPVSPGPLLCGIRVKWPFILLTLDISWSPTVFGVEETKR